ncbi:hypothetical protein RZS08_46470, partial [Arthrospira platensis SPKY1]|nr:hypothetical protein [Arthrospira platensis SPKY1]
TETRELEGSMGFARTFFNGPVLYAFAVILFTCLWFFGGDLGSILGLFGVVFFSLVAIVHFHVSHARWADWYEKLLGNWAPFTILTFIAVAIGGAVQIIPTLSVQRAQNLEDRVQ